MSVRSLVRVAFLALLALASAPVAAQGQRAFVRSAATVAEIRTDSDRLGDVINTWSIPGNTTFTGESRVVGAGRYLLLETTRDEAVVLDTSSGEVTVTLLFHVLGGISEGRELVTYYVPFNSLPYAEVVTIETQARRRVDMPPGCIRAVAVAEQARLMVLRAEHCTFAAPPARWIDLVSLDGAPTRERVVDVPPAAGQTIATNPDGSRLWVSTASEGFPMPRGMAVFDLAAGRPLAQTSAVAPIWPSDTRLLPDRNVLLSVTTGGLTALDPESLRVLGTADAPRDRLRSVPLPPGYRHDFGYKVLAHDDAEAVIVYERSGTAVNPGDEPCLQAALIALDPDTGRRTASRDARDPITGRALCALDMAMAVAPPSPGGLAATVSGSRVSLTWQASREATHYEVEAGSAPGLRNLARYVTGDTSLTAPDALRSRSRDRPALRAASPERVGGF